MAEKPSLHVDREVLTDEDLNLVLHRIPTDILSHFEDPAMQQLYMSLLHQLIDESLPEGSTILQVIVVERAAYYFTCMRAIETNKASSSTEDKTKYRFYVQEFNRNLEILRQLAAKSLTSQQAAILAKRTVRVIEQTVSDEKLRGKVIGALIAEYKTGVTI
jgi:hypothetical protein